MNQNGFNIIQGTENVAPQNPEVNTISDTKTPEISVQSTPENTVQVGGAPTQASDDQINGTSLPTDIVIDNTNIIEEPTSDVLKNEIKEENSSHVDSSDNSYIKELKKIIKEDADEPYVELEKAEGLEIAYLKDRFGVNVKDEDN